MTRLAVICSGKSVLQIFDLLTKEKRQEISLPNRPHEILVCGHMAYVTITYRDGGYNHYDKEAYEIVTIDLNENQVKNILDLRPNHSRPHGLFRGPQTGYLYVSCESNNGELLRMDINDKLKVGVFFFEAQFLSMFFFKDIDGYSYSCSWPSLVYNSSIREKSIYS